MKYKKRLKKLVKGVISALMFFCSLTVPCETDAKEIVSYTSDNLTDSLKIRFDKPAKRLIQCLHTVFKDLFSKIIIKVLLF